MDRLIRHTIKYSRFRRILLSGILSIVISSCVLTAQGLIIDSGGTLVNTGNIILTGDLTNNNVISDNSGTFVFAGTTQTIDGTSAVDFNSITIASGSTTAMSTAGQTASGIVLSNGTLNTNGNLTLLSTASGTALIDGSGTGLVNGNITMQRYLSSGYGYKYFSSPFQASTVNEFGDDMNLLAAFHSFYSYDEGRTTSGWVSYITPTNVLNPLEGYAVHFGSVAAPNTTDVAGLVNNGALSVTLYNNNNTYTTGFNLVGNPYPSPIDWDAAAGWTKTNIDDALYYFKASTLDQ